MTKRLLSVLLALSMVLTLFPINVFAMEAVAFGTCGDDLSWRLDSDGTLTISGIGTMTDYGINSPSWYDNLDNIKTVIIKDGAPSIGNSSFRACNNLTNVAIPSSITNVGNWAFSWCYRLPEIAIPYGTITIGSYAFNCCENLRTCIHIRNCRMTEGFSRQARQIFAGIIVFISRKFNAA